MCYLETFLGGGSYKRLLENIVWVYFRIYLNTASVCYNSLNSQLATLHPFAVPLQISGLFAIKQYSPRFSVLGLFVTRKRETQLHINTYCRKNKIWENPPTFYARFCCLHLNQAHQRTLCFKAQTPAELYDTYFHLFSIRANCSAHLCQTTEAP
jgi:hypothetical protein